MGSRGLGQLAFDKGMRILASSQADKAALESDRLEQGLLSYALVRDGLERKEADFLPKDREITLSEWLCYGTRRVPTLYVEVGEGRIQGVRGIHITREGGPAAAAQQQPTLFDFTKKRGNAPTAWRRDHHIHP